MANVASLQVVIGAKIDGFQKQIDAAQKILKQKFSPKGLGISKDVLELIGGLGTAVTAVGAAAVHAAAQMEQTSMAFTTLLKSSKLAKVYLEELTQFAASTPFSLPGVLSASKRLLAFGFTAQQTIPVMTALGDAAAGLGVGEEGIDRLTLAVGQMLAKGKVSAEEMLQLAEAGIPAWQMLADKIGTSIPEAMAMAQKGMVSSATGIQAIMSGIHGKFGGMMKNMSSTVLGMISNIQDSVGQLMTVIGQQITDGLNLKPALKTAMDDLGNFTDKVKSMGIGDALRETIPVEVGMAFSALAGIVVATAIPALAKLGLTAAATAMKFVGITGPIGIAITAISAGLYWLWQNWDWLGVQIDYVMATVTNSVRGAGGEIAYAFASMVHTAAENLNSLFSLVGASSDLADQAREWAINEQAAAKATIEAAEANQMLAESTRTKLAFRYSSMNAPTNPMSDFQAADINNLGLKEGPAPSSIGGSEAKQAIEEAREVANARLTFNGVVLYDELENINILKNARSDEALVMSEMLASYHDQRMTMEQEFSNFILETNETIINQLSNGLASAIMEGNSLGKTFVNITKNIAQMFLTWTIQRRAQAALDSLLNQKGSKENIANAIKEGKALVNPAIQKSIAIAGPLNGIPTYTAAVSTMKAAGEASITPFANGGYVAGPGSGTADRIPAMLSNGEYVVKASAVRDVGISFLNDLNNGRGSGTSVIITNNNYGDFNNGTDYDDYMDGINEAVAKGLGGVML